MRVDRLIVISPFSSSSSFSVVVLIARVVVAVNKITVPAAVVKSKMSGSATSHFLRRRLALRLGKRLPLGLGLGFGLGLVLETATGAAQEGFKRKIVFAVVEAGGVITTIIVIADMISSERTLFPLQLHTAN